jgi:tetratricopeptide (TPR) repeat protein
VKWIITAATIGALVAPLGSVSAAAQQPPREAWDALDAGRLQDASDRFDDLVRQLPRDPFIHLGAGITAHRLGRRPKARAALEEALRIAPDLTPAALLLGDILSRDGDLHEAIVLYESLLVLQPGDPIVIERLERWRAERALHEQFRQSASPNFTVLFEGPAEEALAERALELLEAAFWRIGASLGVYPTQAITLVLYTGQQFRDVTRSPAWAAGLFDGRIRIPVREALKNEDEFARVLAHEFTHALVHGIAPGRGVPYWLHEGLATIFEREQSTWSRDQIMEAGRVLPLASLAESFRGLPEGDLSLGYAVSALATEALLHRAGAPSVVALLQDLANGEDFRAAFAHRILIPFDEFAATWWH